MLLDDFLSKDAFTMVNKKLAKIIGIGQTVFLSELLYQRRKFGQSEFYYVQDELEDELGITPKTQQRYIKELKELGLISVNRGGTFNKNLFKINDDKIILVMTGVLPNEETSTDKMSELDRTKCLDSIYIDKKESKKLSPSPLELALDEFWKYRKSIKKEVKEESSRKRIVSRLNNLANSDDEKVAIIYQTIDNGWTGFYPLKEQSRNPLPMEDLKQSAVQYYFNMRFPDKQLKYKQYLEKYGVLDKWKELAESVLGPGFIS